MFEKPADNNKRLGNKKFHKWWDYLGSSSLHLYVVIPKKARSGGNSHSAASVELDLVGRMH